MSVGDWSKVATSELYKTGRDVSKRAEERQKLMAIAGVELPQIDSLASIQSTWFATQRPAVSGSETQQEITHAARLTELAGIISDRTPGIPKRQFVRVGNFVYGGAPNVKGSSKPKMVVVPPDATESSLKDPSIFSRTHLYIETKTRDGTDFTVQCMKYVERYRKAGASFTFVVGLKADILAVLLFTPKAWAEVARFSYAECDHYAIQWLTFILSDKAVDSRLERRIGEPINLFGAEEAQKMYTEGVKAGQAGKVDLKDIKLGRKIFESPGVFGSMTQCWEATGVRRIEQGGWSDREAMIVKYSLVRKGRLPNGQYFMDLVAQTNSNKYSHWFAKSLGFWFDPASVELEEETGCRLGVVQVMLPASGLVWREAWPDKSIADFLRAARDAVRVLWVMRPFHHRDISIGNLMINAAVARDEHEDQRMEKWLAWVGEGPPPPLVGQVIDFERGRLDLEASDYSHRVAAATATSAEADDSLDDAHTGTYAFMARAQKMARGIMTRVQERSKDDRRGFDQLVKWILTNGRHQYWHDVESIILCVLHVVHMKLAQVEPAVKEVCDRWRARDPFVAVLRGEWYDAFAKEVHYQVAAEGRVSEATLEISRVICEMVTDLRLTFAPTLAQQGDATIVAIEKAYFPWEDNFKQCFHAVLRALIDTIPLVEELEKQVGQSEEKKQTKESAKRQKH